MNQPEISIKWTYGEPYEKTSIHSKNPFTIETIKMEENNRMREIKKFAIGESNQKQLEREFICSEEQPQLLYGNVVKESFQKKENKRDENNNKILDREMIMQTSQNPFMIKNDYVNDLTVQDEFLKPKSSSYKVRDDIEQ